MTDLQADLLTVGALFAEDAHAEIPIYQRNYAWGVEQIEQLIEDVWAAAQAGASDYFLGNLIVASSPPTAGTRTVTYEVVDGQQRLTTLSMLLTYLQVAVHARVTYQSRRNATDALTRLTSSDDDDGAGIHRGFKVIRSRMAKFTTPEEEAFRHFLLERVQLVRAVLPEGTDLNRYFEIMNTRGQQLEQVDIVKARLMSYLRDDDDVDAARACFGWVWDACAQMDSYVQMALTPGDTQLRETVFGGTWDRLDLRGFSQLCPLRPQTDRRTGGARTVGLSVRDALRRYASVPEAPVVEDPENRRFESPIRFPSLLLHALKVMQEAGEDVDGQLDDSKLIRLFEAEFATLSESERSERSRRFAEVLLQCRFTLDNHVLKREYTANNAEDGAWSLKRLALGETVREKGRVGVTPRYPGAFAPDRQDRDDVPVDHATREILQLQSMLRVTYTSPRTMHWITAVLRADVHDLPRPEAAARIRLVLEAHARRKVQQAFFAGPSRPAGFDIERIVFTYLDRLLAQRDGRDFTFVFRNSVEHFFPQHADRENDGWEAVLPEHEELHLLGNLALVSVSTNSKFSNNMPLHKAGKSEIVRQSAKLQLMAELVKAGTLWDRAAIRAHHQEMVRLLEEDLRGAGLQVP